MAPHVTQCELLFMHQRTRRRRLALQCYYCVVAFLHWREVFEPIWLTRIR